MISLDPEVLAPTESGYDGNERFVVSGNFDKALVIAALGRASERFYGVAEDGVEYPVTDDDPVNADGDLLYTPNYVSRPKETDEGLQVYVDCKGEITADMSETLRRVLREELEATGVDASVQLPAIWRDG